MKAIDYTLCSAHVIIDRKWRMEWIEKTIGYGIELYTCPDFGHDNHTLTLTSTGVLVVRESESNMIVTLWIASVSQAIKIFRNATNKAVDAMPKRLWDIINYNNNTAYWKKVVA